MNMKKLLVLILGGVLFMGCLAGGRAAAGFRGSAALSGAAGARVSETAAWTAVASAGGDGGAGEISYEELFRRYEPFGLVYDSGKGELRYQGRRVRWFEDYYAIGEGIEVGNDFLDEDGVVDVYAVRDFTGFVRSRDGSFDPGGALVGVREFSEAEFAARDVEAIKNPPPAVAIAGDAPSEKELADMAGEYEAFGVTYDGRRDQWYFYGERVRFFWDVLISNGEELGGGRFEGAVRTLGSGDGTVDIYTVRDFTRLNEAGEGALIGVEKFSQEEFEEHTGRELRAGSGFCIVTED